MAYTCGYPINHEISVDETGTSDYEITLDGDIIYTARVHTLDSGSGTVEVDISPICREFLETSFEDFPTLAGTSTKSVRTFSVDGADYDVCYNYNTDYIFEIDYGTNLNTPITELVDPRQYLGTSILTSGGITVSHSRAGGAAGAQIQKGLHKYVVVAPCNNHYALYYVNKNGGIDYLLCAGKATEKTAADRTEHRMYTNMDQRLSFANYRTVQFMSKKYELNTGWISDARAQNIDNLIYSPKVWIHNLNADTITACNVDESSFTVKKHKYDKTVSYTINVTESKKYIRK